MDTGYYTLNMATYITADRTQKPNIIVVLMQVFHAAVAFIIESGFVLGENTAISTLDVICM